MTKLKTPEKPKAERKERFFYAVGKRKSSIARVCLYENGKGDFTINEHPMEEYFFGEMIGSVKSPLKLVDMPKRFDIVVEAIGGGISSQADAVRHGISKALTVFDPSLRILLKKAGYMTRDSRVKERKKPGLRRARRAPQWSKR
ncbi:MAG TPA: 30S ribosomal protein S9 [candidate division Zixibacteria bacterium]|nr:30S ribosomal protein S9 [candidate division Zixibacteria bacterium]